MNKKSIKIINLVGEVCPMTFVKTRLAIEKIENNKILKFIYDSEEAKINVPKSIEEIGHSIIDVKNIDKNKFYIIIK